MKFNSFANLKKVGLLLSAVLLVISSFVLSAAPASADTYTVKMGTDKGLLAFEPAKLTIKSGESVKWEMNKLAPHNILFDTSGVPGKNEDLAQELSHAKLLNAKGQSFESTFTTPGT